MKRAIVVVLIGVTGFLISTWVTYEVEDCMAGCIPIHVGFPINSVSNFTANYSLLLLDCLIWVGFVLVLSEVVVAIFEKNKLDVR
jgi:hypothetical protein